MTPAGGVDRPAELVAGRGQLRDLVTDAPVLALHRQHGIAPDRSEGGSGSGTALWASVAAGAAAAAVALTGVCKP